MSCGFAGSLWFNTAGRLGSIVNVALQQGQATTIVEVAFSDIISPPVASFWITNAKSAITK
jgi:hypothetical protein